MGFLSCFPPQGFYWFPKWILSFDGFELYVIYLYSISFEIETIVSHLSYTNFNLISVFIIPQTHTNLIFEYSITIKISLFPFPTLMLLHTAKFFFSQSNVCERNQVICLFFIPTIRLWACLLLVCVLLITQANEAADLCKCITRTVVKTARNHNLLPYVALVLQQGSMCMSPFINPMIYSFCCSFIQLVKYI